MALSRLQLIIPCLAAGLLLSGRAAKAQIVITGPFTPTSVSLKTWLDHHLPARCTAKGRFEVHLLNDSQMAAYLSDGDSTADQNSHADDGEIDGVFEDDPPRITLRIPTSGEADMYTFAHEYGHYVWFDLMTKDDRKRYEAVYKKQKAAHHLVTRYAQTDVEEGFAEAFSFYANEAPLLQKRDAASYQYLTQWAAPSPAL